MHCVNVCPHKDICTNMCVCVRVSALLMKNMLVPSTNRNIPGSTNQRSPTDKAWHSTVSMRKMLLFRMCVKRGSFPSEGCFCLSMTHRQLIRFSPDHYRDIPPQQKECLSLLLQSTAETEKRQSSIMKCSGSLQMTHHTSRCFSSVLPSDLSPHFISRRRQKQQMYSEEMLP